MVEFGNVPDLRKTSLRVPGGHNNDNDVQHPLLFSRLVSSCLVDGLEGGGVPVCSPRTDDTWLFTFTNSKPSPRYNRDRRAASLPPHPTKLSSTRARDSLLLQSPSLSNLVLSIGGGGLSNYSYASSPSLVERLNYSAFAPIRSVYDGVHSVLVIF